MEWEPFNKPKPLLVNMSYTQFTGEITQGVSWYYSLPLPIRGGYKKATLVSVNFKNIYTGGILASIGIEIKAKDFIFLISYPALSNVSSQPQTL